MCSPLSFSACITFVCGAKIAHKISQKLQPRVPFRRGSCQLCHNCVQLLCNCLSKNLRAAELQVPWPQETHVRFGSTAIEKKMVHQPRPKITSLKSSDLWVYETYCKDLEGINFDKIQFVETFWSNVQHLWPCPQIRLL
jgi:hypothetical protein